MKLTYCALALLSITTLFSCRKDGEDIDIKTFDDNEIKTYIAANNLTGLKRDAGDTTGIYYQILAKGTGANSTIKYEDNVSYVYSVRSLDGKFAQSDTITNHGYGPAGLITPPGVMLAINNLMKNKGTRARMVIPSRLAYGSAGNGTGAGRLPGNVSLDYYINIIDNQANYDDFVIQKYITTNSLTGFTKILPNDPVYKSYAGMYYKITQAGDGTTLIKDVAGSPASIVTESHTLKLLNGTVIEENTTGSANDLNNPDVFAASGFKGALLLAGSLNAKISVIMPSRLGYGTASTSAFSPNTCLYFDITVTGVTN